RFDGKDVQGCREGAEHARRGGDAYAGHQPHVARCQRRAERNLAPRTRCADGNAALAGGGRGRIAGGNSPAGGRPGGGIPGLRNRDLHCLVQDRFAARAMAIVPAECPCTAKGALPGKESKDCQEPKLRPTPAVQPAKMARAAVFADSVTQQVDLLIRLDPTKGCCFGWPHARWKRPEITEDCAGGEPGLMPRLVLIRRILLALKRAALSHQGSALSQKGCSGRSGRVNPSGTGHLPSAEGVTFFTPSRSLSILAH